METRELLLLTAERLFGERGLNGVSLREIVRAAGQRNVSALHYHFGSREGLIEAIFEKRMQALDRRRMAMLDDIEAEGREHDIRAVAEAIVWPLAELLLREDDSSHYVRFLTEMFLTSDFEVENFVDGRFDHGMRRAYRMLEGALSDIPSSILRQRFLLVAHAGAFAVADIDTARIRRRAKGKSFDVERAIHNLIDIWVGAITAPIGEKTAAKVGKRAAEVGRRGGGGPGRRGRAGARPLI